jgi:hypothetical protein
MEQKRFGVKNSLIKELRLFQLALQQKRLTMPFSTRAEVFAGEEYSYETITASPRKIRYQIVHLPSINLPLPKQPLRLTNETGLKLRINNFLCITIKFTAAEERTEFAEH